MAHEGYKLTVLHRLQKMPHSDYRRAMIFFPLRLSVHRTTWERWIYMRKSDPAEIPGSAIIKMALFFDCHPMEIYSDPLTKDQMIEDWETFNKEYEDYLQQTGNHV